MTRLRLEAAIQKNVRDGYESIVMERLKRNRIFCLRLSLPSGEPLISIANKRIRAIGESKVAKTVFSLEIDELASKIAQKLNLIGPWNVQLMGPYCSLKIIEINPRVAGSLSLIMASGLDYIGLMIKIFTGEKISLRELKYTPGTIMTEIQRRNFFET